MKHEENRTRSLSSESQKLWQKVLRSVYAYRYAVIVNTLVVYGYVLWVNSLEDIILWYILLVSTPAVAGGTSIVLGIAAYDDDRSRVLVLTGVSAIIVSVVMFVFVVL